MRNAARFVVSGRVLVTFIDWRSYPTVDRAALSAGIAPLNLVVWSKTNAGMGSLSRSAHELLPLYKKGTDPRLNNVELGEHGAGSTRLGLRPLSTLLRRSAYPLAGFLISLRDPSWPTAVGPFSGERDDRADFLS